MISLVVFGLLSIMVAAWGLYHPEKVGDSQMYPKKYLIITVLCLIPGLVAYPFVNVYQKELVGKAALKEAEWNRQIEIKESEAYLASAKNFADAEVVRAEGAKKANVIVSKSLGGPKNYLMYLYIMGMKENENKEIYYIPTEAGLPVLEAGKRHSY